MSAWAKFQNDFDAMSDNDIIDETRRMEDQLEEAEEWLEAVAAWEDAGKPRATKAPDTLAEGGAVAWRWRYKGTDWRYSATKPAWPDDEDEIVEPLFTRPAPIEPAVREKVINAIDLNEAFAANVMDENRIWLAKILADEILALLSSNTGEG